MSARADGEVDEEQQKATCWALVLVAAPSLVGGGLIASSLWGVSVDRIALVGIGAALLAAPAWGVFSLMRRARALDARLGAAASRTPPGSDERPFGLRARAAHSCSLCLGALADETPDAAVARATCAGCGTEYHAECLAELGGCATLGCSSASERRRA